MTFYCPKCNRYGMEWDGRAKVLMCYYNSCNHVIRIENQKRVPSPEKISEVIEEDAKRMRNNVHTDTTIQLGLSSGAAGT
jgi:hypothetical protein